MADQTELFAEQLSQFIATSKSEKQVWGLKAEDGWLSCQSEITDHEVMPFWSTKTKAAVHAVDEWSDFEVLEIPLDIFVEDWLLTLDEDDVLLGIEWDENLAGVELSAKELLALYQA